MKRFLTALSLFSVFFYAGCSDQQVQKENSEQSQESFQATNIARPPLKIVTSFYPIYEIVHKVGGNNVTLTNLVPAGVEPHDYEPAPQDIISLNKADLVIYNGAGLESWSDKIIPDLQKSGVEIMNLSDLFLNDVIKNDPKKPDEEEYLPYDPHFWMDPVNYQKEVQVVSQKLSELDPVHKAEYEQNAQNFLKQLQDLDIAYQNGLKNCKQNNFVTNHAAFAYLSNRYNLTMIPISGLSPDSEPSLKTMADLAGVIKQKNIQYILTESLVSPKIAETLANETGAKTLVLNPLEGLTNEEISQGKNYISVMQDNLKNLQAALECQ